MTGESIMSSDTLSLPFSQTRERIESFRGWRKSDVVRPIDLANAGFYYTGFSDLVRCFACHVEICRWEPNDVPLNDHARFSPECFFVRRLLELEGRNTERTAPVPAPRSRDVCGPSGQVAFRDTETSSAKAVVDRTEPAHPEYRSNGSRLASFEHWPKHTPQKKEVLASCGFFYTGLGDRTLCYQCGLGLKDWEPTDNPWEQHAKHSNRRCRHLTSVVQEWRHLLIRPKHGVDRAMVPILPSIEETLEALTVEPSAPQSSSSSQRGSAPVTPPPPPNMDTIDVRNRCKICFVNDLNVLFLPCKHLVSCLSCSKRISTCIICRQDISFLIRAYMS